MRKTIDRTLVQQTGASVATGNMVARVVGLHPLLHVKIALAWVGTRPGSFGTNTMLIHAFDRTGAGEAVQLSGTPVNGGSGQTAPESWEGQTGVPELQVTHAYQGVANAGRWVLLVSVAPSSPMCESEFLAMANEVSIVGTDPVTLP